MPIYKPYKSFLTTFLALYTLLQPTPAEAPPGNDNSPGCSCYLISGPNAGYFTYHRFWDFRDIANDGENDYTFAPPLVTASEDNGNQSVTSSYFNSSNWQRDWEIQSWSQDATEPSPVKSVNSAQNVYVSRNTTTGAGNATYLTLRASRLQDFMSIAEIDATQTSMLRSSLRARIRIIPKGLANPAASSTGAESSLAQEDRVASGAVLGLFTYNSSTEESDIEILTRDAHDRIRYTNQPDYDAKTDTSYPGASSDVVMPEGYVWTGWLEHRMDWTETVTRWWVDGTIVVNKSVNVPRDPSGVILNLWGDGGDWSGNMTVGDSVIVGVEWIEVVFNVSGQDARPRCEVGCRVDGIRRAGWPEVAFNRTGERSAAAGLLRGEVGRPILGTLLALLLLWPC